jgi:parvulin-like peptidyl-prolyl isomerase
VFAALGGRACLAAGAGACVAFAATVALAAPATTLEATSNAASAGTRALLDRVVAVVDGEVILLSELERAMVTSDIARLELSRLPPDATPAQLDRVRREMRPRVLEDLIDRALIRKEAERFQIVISDADVERALPSVAQSYGLESVPALREAVTQSGEYASWDEYLVLLKDDILTFRTTQYLSTVSVSEAEVREFYRKQIRDEQASVDAQRLLFSAAGTDAAARDRAFAQAQLAARRLRSGDPLETVVGELEDVAQTELRVLRGSLAPQLEDAVFAAKEGAIVGPLATGQGYVVFQVIARNSAETLSFEAAKDKIRAQLEAEAFERAAAEFRQSLRAKAFLDIRL